MNPAHRHRCIRCGNDVRGRGVACKDCLAVDPATCRALSPSAPRRKAVR